MNIDNRIIGIEIDHSLQSNTHYIFWNDLQLQHELQRINTSDEIFILSTCNRWVLYAYTDHINFFEDYVKNKFPECNYKIYSTTEHAILNLFEVASGLKSRLIGEHEILGQLRNALAINNASKKIGPILNEFVRHAITVGKKVRTESSIGAFYTSYSSISLNLIHRKFGKETPLNILVVGTGKIGRMMLKITSKLNLKEAFLASHSLERAASFASEYGYEPVKTQEIASILSKVDVVIGCTHCELSFDPENLGIPAIGLNQKLFIDFGVPPNFPDWLNDFSAAELFSIGDIQAINDQNVNKRKKEIPKVKQLIKSEFEIFVKSHQERKISHLLKSCQASAEQKRHQHLQWLLNKLDDLNERDLKIIEKFSHRISSEFTRNQYQVLRELSSDLENNLAKLELIQSLTPK